jgi:hypothetical protein
MHIKKIIAVVAVFAAANSAFAQQTEFVTPDANFKTSLTRGEVRQNLAQATAKGTIAQQQHDGQDPVNASGKRSRQQVRAEEFKAGSIPHRGQVGDTFFGS